MNLLGLYANLAFVSIQPISMGPETTREQTPRPAMRLPRRASVWVRYPVWVLIILAKCTHLWWKPTRVFCFHKVLPGTILDQVISHAPSNAQFLQALDLWTFRAKT